MFLPHAALMVVVAWGAPEGRSVDLLASMDHWRQVGGGPDSFAIQDRQLLLKWTRREPGDLITRADYENFDLSFECRLAPYAESGLYIHAPRNGACRAGLELELANHYGEKPTTTGPCSIFRHVAPRATPMKEPGEWNAVKVHMDWPRLTVHVNGEMIHDLDLSTDEELKYKLRRGAIGFQNLGWDVEIRNLVLTELPDTERAMPLFNGKDLTGWTVDGGQAEWRVQDGAISATGDGYLKHEKIVEDFDLRLLVRTSNAANGGVYFRWLRMDPFRDRGHEIQILDVPGAIMTTGSIYGRQRGDDLPITPGQWELLQVFVRGPEAVVYLNGVRSCATTNLKHVRPGHICLQMHRGGTTIEFKDMLLVPVK